MNMKNLDREFEGVVELYRPPQYQCSICGKVYDLPNQAKDCFDQGFLGPEITPGLVLGSNDFLKIRNSFQIFVIFKERFQELTPLLANLHSKGYIIINLAKSRKNFSKKTLSLPNDHFEFLNYKQNHSGEGFLNYAFPEAGVESSLFKGKLISDATFEDFKERLSNSDAVLDKLGKFKVTIENLYSYHPFFDSSAKKSV
jgi:hypothetical protein